MSNFVELDVGWNMIEILSQLSGQRDSSMPNADDRQEESRKSAHKLVAVLSLRVLAAEKRQSTELVQPNRKGSEQFEPLAKQPKLSDAWEQMPAEEESDESESVLAVGETARHLLRCLVAEVVHSRDHRSACTAAAVSGASEALSHPQAAKVLAAEAVCEPTFEAILDKLQA
eukprot:SAG31_NODE_3185_length_4579_cov_2.704911_4_plen_172_part_00